MINYLKDILKNNGYREWEDALNFENIPNSLLDKSYHLEIGQGRGQKIHEILHNIRIRLFYKGYKNPASATNLAYDEMEKLATLIIAGRISHAKIKNIVFNNYQIEKQDKTNDNNVMLMLDFDIVTMLNVI